jgi:hypothetical protein
MRSRQAPSADTLFVRTASPLSSEAFQRLARHGEVERVPGAGGIVVHLHSAASDLKTVSRAIEKELGEGTEVDPILLDETGEAHYPTGEVTVRFRQGPESAELAEFARRHGLQFRSRNKYVPAQVVFAAPRAYLPELLDSLNQAGNVAAAWANTISRYRRA